MHTFNKPVLALAALSLIGLATAPSWAGNGADTIIPPNDPVGQVFTTNFNDGYGAETSSSGRGIGFTPTASVTLNSVGLYEDLTNKVLSYQVAQVNSLTGQVDTGETILRSGSTTVTTNGLQFIDFSFSKLALTPGNDYYVNFSFNGNGNQNFFYNNQNVIFTQDVYASIDGTANGNTVNSLMPAIRLNGGGAPVPEASSIVSLGLLLALGLGSLAVARRRRTSACAE